VSRSRNAVDFRTAFLGAKSKYDYVFRDRIDRLHAKLDKPSKVAVDDSLEYHSRCFIINTLLEGLNWRLNAKPQDGLPNVLPETAVRSEASGTRRFLDYLGFERETLKPLLVVEAKRLKAPLPVLATLPKPGTRGVPVLPDETLMGYSMAISQGLVGDKLSGEWNQWLRDLKDYILSIRRRTPEIPRRVVLTNGEWLILFLQPSDAFLQDDDHPCPPEAILVFKDANEIANRSAELCRFLEHQHVLDEVPFLAPGDIAFHVTGPSVRTAMHGLRLRYEQSHALKVPSPIIHVAPVVILRTELGATIRVENPDEQFELPHAREQLGVHLTTVASAAQKLLRDIGDRLERPLTPAAIEDHFNDPQSFGARKTVTRSSGDEYFLVTGQHTHYFRAEPSVPDCPYHEWGKSNSEAVAAPPAPITISSVKDRSFFFSGQTHHCAHAHVLQAKSNEITAANRTRCGPRSGEDGEPFCEIWSFEQRLCCRTCAFETVCTKTQVFRLPCERLVQIQPFHAAAIPAAP
jgi:hypothetical protein